MDLPAPVRNEDIIARVRELLGKYPELTSRQLFDLAIRMQPSLEEGGIRSFHARYVLPIRREKASAEGRIRPRALRKKVARKEAQPAPSSRPGRKRTEMDDQAITDAAAARGRIRGVLLRFARQIAGSKTRADLVDVLANVDNLVDEIAPEIAASRP